MDPKNLHLSIRSSDALDLREVSARITLDIVRQKGHSYVELRRAGKRRTIFFCTLCLTSCFSDDVLFEHLGGNQHAKRYANAKTTLFGPNPWPFSDGVLFFNEPVAGNVSGCSLNEKSFKKMNVGEGMEMSVIGVGHVGSRMEVGEDGRNRIGKIWCEWMGNEIDGVSVLAKCDFGLGCFKYSYELGRNWSLDVDEEMDGGGKKRKKSFSDAEEGGLELARVDSSKSFRREVRRRKRVTAEKTCDICAQEMIQGKDVGTLVNCKTGKLACSSRNTNGAFHLFHVSCLVHWILLCEFELRTDQMGCVKSRGRKKKDAPNKPIFSIFCPECQGTGKHIVEDELEKPSIPLSEVFLYKLKALEAHKSWMKNPEALEKCSTGLHFPSKSDKENEEKVVPMKLLRFYVVDGKN